MKQPVYAPGTIVGGRYRIDKAIARGGCSIVYRGTHVDMNRSVALKIMSSGNGELDESWTQRFQREAQLASHLRHPNTIITYDYGHDKGLWYIVMEWVEGASLRNAIKDLGPMEARRTARLTLQILKSLTEAHRQHILHRDLKPSNIMLTHDMEGAEMVKVLDFGLAKADPRQMTEHQLKLTRDGDFVGTPRYASPEQLRGHDLTPAADIYGVGMVMWEMLTGKAGVPRIDYATCVEYHLGPRPWRMPPGVYPPGLATIVERALEKDPERRFQSCEEMARALVMWLSAEDDKKVSLFEEESSLFDGIVEEISSEASLKPRPTTPLVMPERNKGASTHRVSDEGFSAVDAGSLELDRTAAASSEGSRKTQRSAPIALTPQRYPLDEEKTPWAVWLLGGCVIALGLAGVVYLFAVREVPQPAEIPEDPLTINLEKKRLAAPPSREKMNQQMIEAQLETRRPEDLWMLLRREGWSFDPPETTEISGVSQTTLRMRKQRMSVDVTFYEVEELSLAKDFEYNTQAPAEAVRFGLTVIRMNPAGSRSSQGIRELRDYFLRIKGLANTP